MKEPPQPASLVSKFELRNKIKIKEREKQSKQFQLYQRWKRMGKMNSDIVKKRLKNGHNM